MKWQRRNELLNDAFSREYANGFSNMKIAEKLQLCASMVERQLHSHHSKLLKERLNYPCPIVQGIDGHSLHCRRTRGHKSAVTLTDLRKHRIDEVFEGRDGKTLELNLR